MSTASLYVLRLYQVTYMELLWQNTMYLFTLYGESVFSPSQIFKLHAARSDCFCSNFLALSTLVVMITTQTCV